MYKTFTPVITILFCVALTFACTNSYAKGGLKYEKIKQFIPEGYQVFDTASGDFNADGYRDYAIVLENISEKANANSERPLLLLKGSAKGKFELLARNDNVVLCGNCGGMFGDPYKRVFIKGNLLSIEHSVGGNLQWTRVITFRYNAETKDIVLHEDITKSGPKSAPQNQKSIASNKDDFGTLSFASYSYNKGF